MEKGWIKLYRKLLSHEIFKSKDDKLFKTFIYCLLRANHKDTEVYFNRQRVQLKAGQFITGREQASRDLGYSPKTFDRKINDLLNERILTRYMTRRFSIISIDNWQTYQGRPEENDPLPDPLDDPLNGTNLTTDKKYKEGKTLSDHPNPAIKDFIDFWYQSFKEKFKEAYKVTGGKEGKIIQDLLKTYPVERLKALGKVFFESQDPFIQKSGYTIGVFSSQINKVIAEEKQKKDSW